MKPFQCRKIKFNTPEAAILALQGCRRSNARLKRSEQGHYYCNLCQAWHLTSKQTTPQAMIPQPQPKISLDQAIGNFKYGLLDNKSVAEIISVLGVSPLTYEVKTEKQTGYPSMGINVSGDRIIPLYEVEITRSQFAKIIKSGEKILELPIQHRIDILARYSGQCLTSAGTKWLAYQQNNKWYIVKKST